MGTLEGEMKMRNYHVPSCTCHQCLCEKTKEPFLGKKKDKFLSFCETCNKEVSPIMDSGISSDGEPKWIDICPDCRSILSED